MAGILTGDKYMFEDIIRRKSHEDINDTTIKNLGSPFLMVGRKKH